MARRLRRRSLLATLMAAVTALTVTSTSSADTSTSNRYTPSDRAPTMAERLQMEEERLDPVAKRLMEMGKHDASFNGVAVDSLTNTVTLWRVGGDDAEAATYRAAAQAGGVNVEVRPAMLSKAQVDKISAQIDAEFAELDRQGIRITTYGGLPRSGPYRIGVVGAEQHRAFLQQRYGRYGLDTIEVVEEAPPETLTRADDFPPYFGGARLKPAGLGTKFGCSSGFAMISLTSRVTYILTVSHCANPDDTRFWDGGDDFMGRVVETERFIDMALIQVSAGPYIYDGAIGAEFSKEVTDSEPPVVGNNVCTSGAASGARCYARIDQVDARWTVTHIITGERYAVRGARARNDSGAEVAGTGDSGGPVFTPHGNVVTARGIVSAGAGTGVKCVGLSFSGRNCFSAFYFPDIFTDIEGSSGLSVRSSNF